LPPSSNRHRSTASATSENTAKFVPLPSYVGPSGYGRPGQASIGSATGFTHLRGDSSAINRVQQSPVHYFQRPDARYLSYDAARTTFTGSIANLQFSKTKGNWLYDLEAGWESPAYDPNDAGRLGNADGRFGFAGLRYRQTKPRGWYQNYNFALSGQTEYDFGGDRQFLFGIDLSVLPRQCVALVGESGSGKTTLARCIARLIEPTRGEVRVGGVDLARLKRRELRAVRRRVQMVFQDPYRSLNPRRSVGEAIIEGPLNYGVPRSEALSRARRLMELVRLDPAALGRYPHQFSGGQRQRICIARALALEPELLVADEPVSALDVSVQAQVLALLEEIRTRLDLAMLFITHDLRVAAQVCDRVAVMHAGRIVEQGDAEQVFLRPQHEYTRALFAAAPGRDFNFAPRVN